MRSLSSMNSNFAQRRLSVNDAGMAPQRLLNEPLTFTSSIEAQLDQDVIGPLAPLLGASHSGALAARHDCCGIYSLVTQEYLYRLGMVTCLVQSRYVTDDEAVDHVFLVGHLSANQYGIIDPTAGQFLSVSLGFDRRIQTLVIALDAQGLSEEIAVTLASSDFMGSVPFLNANHLFDTVYTTSDDGQEQIDAFSQDTKNRLHKARVVHAHEMKQRWERCLSTDDLDQVKYFLGSMYSSSTDNERMSLRK